MKKKLSYVVSKTPLRISFLGGGTDIPYFYKKYGGATFSIAINKFVYVTVKRHSKYFIENYRLNYYDTEICHKISKIKNSIIRETLKFFKIKTPLYISVISDIPTGSGLGGSSSFIIGLINALCKLENIKILNASLPNADISATCTVNLYNITRLVDVIEYYTNLDVYFHTSLVQYPKALNIKLLPKNLKDEVTRDVNNWFIDARDKVEMRSTKVNPQKQLQRITKFTQNVLNYMNSEDLHNEWKLFLDYTDALDKFYKTNYLNVYDEYCLYSK